LGPDRDPERLERNGKAVLALAFAMGAFVLYGAATGSIRMAGRIAASLYPPPGKLVDVGGRRLHIYCTGSGSPTVVFESGMGFGWTGWRPVIAEVAKRYRACVYDRAGYGWSEAGPEPRSAAILAAELERLLKDSGTPGPYLLVAHSFGHMPPGSTRLATGLR
jgi:hypothetical protein